MAISIRLAVDGTPVTVEIESRTLLARFLREQRCLTGAHSGRDNARCGACTVHLNGRAIESCDPFAVQRDGMDATAVEGSAKNGIPHPVRAAFRDCHGLQPCGCCTPGMAMRAAAPATRHANLDGDLCRCTGRRNIEKAILAGTEARCAGAPAAGRSRPNEACHERPRSQPHDRHATAAQGDRRWTHRLPGARAAVPAVAGGLDREASGTLTANMAHPHRFAHCAMWLDPLLRYRDFAPKVRGARAMLPHMDAHHSAHGLDSPATSGHSLSAAHGNTRPTPPQERTRGRARWS